MVTQCSSRNFTENLPTWELRAQINSCAIFKALTTFIGAASESTTFFQGLVRQVLTNCICSAPEQTPRQTFLCFNLNTCLRGEERLVHSQCWCESPWQRGRNIPVQSHCRREVSDGSLHAEQGAGLHQACEELAVCAHPQIWWRTSVLYIHTLIHSVVTLLIWASTAFLS